MDEIIIIIIINHLIILVFIYRLILYKGHEALKCPVGVFLNRPRAFAPSKTLADSHRACDRTSASLPTEAERSRSGARAVSVIIIYYFYKQCPTRVYGCKCMLQFINNTEFDSIARLPILCRLGSVIISCYFCYIIIQYPNNRGLDCDFGE